MGREFSREHRPEKLLFPCLPVSLFANARPVRRPVLCRQSPSRYVERQPPEIDPLHEGAFVRYTLQLKHAAELGCDRPFVRFPLGSASDFVVRSKLSADDFCESRAVSPRMGASPDLRNGLLRDSSSIVLGPPGGNVCEGFAPDFRHAGFRRQQEPALSRDAAA